MLRLSFENQEVKSHT